MSPLRTLQSEPLTEVREHERGKECYRDCERECRREGERSPRQDQDEHVSAPLGHLVHSGISGIGRQASTTKGGVVLGESMHLAADTIYGRVVEVQAGWMRLHRVSAVQAVNARHRDRKREPKVTP